MAGSSAAIQTTPYVKQFVSDMSEAEMHRRAHIERGCLPCAFLGRILLSVFP
jgi:hypothetical protein